MAAVFLPAAGLGYITIANYGIPANNAEDLYNQYYNVQMHEIRYFETRDQAIEQSKDTLRNNSTYMAITDKLYELAARGHDTDNSMDYKNLEFRLDSLENELRNAYISQNRELEFASEMLHASYARLADLKRDSTIRDSMYKIPIHQRFEKNWAKLRINYYNSQIRNYQKKLQHLLQNEK